MKTLTLGAIFLSFLLVSCNSSDQKTEEQPVAAEEQKVTTETTSESTETTKLDKVASGMTEAEVKEIMGEPTRLETLTNKEEAKIEDWWYGENQKIRMMKGTVNRVVYNDKREKEIMKEILGARQQGDDEKAKALMKELRDGVR